MKMSDLARIAGVSKSTISRALADSELVTMETRERIKELARVHGYRKDTRASNFRRRQMLTIGVLLPSNGVEHGLVDNPFILEMLGVISDQLEMRGHELLLAKHSNSDPAWISDFIDHRRVDGIIVLGQSIYHDILDKAASDYRALVVWGARVSGQRYVSVGSDNYIGGKLVADHLLTMGRQQFAFMGDIRVPETRLRYEGYRDSLVKAGVEGPTLLNCVEYKPDSTPNVLSPYFAQGRHIDALFASNDMLALGAIQTLRENNLSVPNNVSVVGYDNISLAKYTNPTLTSVHQDRRLAAQLLTDKLFALSNDKDREVESAIMPTELIIRKSSSG